MIMRFFSMMVLLFILSGCGVGSALNDPLGATTRTEIRADAELEAAQAVAAARVRVAEAAAAAEKEKVWATVDTEQAKQAGQSMRSLAWTAIVLPALMTLLAGLILWRIVEYYGRIALLQAQRVAPSRLLPDDPRFYPALHQLAEQIGAQVHSDRNGYYLMQNGQRKPVAYLEG